jgi:hypothetical protein
MIMIEEIEVPPLIALPVLCSDFCDQETTDRLLAMIWEAQLEDLALMAREEQQTFPSNRDEIYRKRSYVVEEFFLEHGAEALARVNSDVAIVHLMNECSRRLRAVQGLHKFPVFGHPLAEKIDGPYPELTAPETHEYAQLETGPVTADIINRVCGRAYREKPELFYALAEELRLSMLTYSVTNRIRAHIKAVIVAEGLEETLPHFMKFYHAFQASLRVMCDIPPFSNHQMAAIFRKLEDPNAPRLRIVRQN